MIRCAYPLWTSLLLLLAGCGVGEGTGSTPPWAQPETPVAPAVADNASAADIDADVELIPPFKVKLETTKGDVVVAVRPEWAPRGAMRFKELIDAGYYDDTRIFRVVPDFVAQFGMHGDPNVNKQWQEKPIKDDRVKTSNKRGTVTFATSGADSRTAQVFFNLKDNPELDTMSGSFAPFAEVIEGIEVVDAFNKEYGAAPGDKQRQIAEGGNLYLDKAFPGLDTIIKATILEESPSEAVPGEDTSDEGAKDDAKPDATPAEPSADDKPETAAPASDPAASETTPPTPDEAAPTDEAEALAEPAPAETPSVEEKSDADQPTAEQ